MKTIVLTGMPGSGKTSVGKLLARSLNIGVTDIDNLIEQKENMTVSEIFQKNGEKYFRETEAETLESIFQPENLVISLGGGGFENPQVREFLLNNSTVVYLKTSPGEILKRLRNNTERPLLNNNMTIERITEIYEKRKSNYELAHITVDTDNKTPNEITREIRKELT